MSEPLVYVLVINWNGREHLADCFDALLASRYGNAVFLLIDNGSDDDSAAFVTGHYGRDPRVAILPCAENRGWSGGNNAGIRKALAADADYIFLLNNDTAVAPRCIESLVVVMEARPECGALAPRMLLFDQPWIVNSIGLEMSIVGAAWDRGIGRADGPAWRESVPVVGACGGAAFFRASVLAETGLLPEEFEIYLDDLDLCLRIWGAGYRIYTCPEASVRHKFSATMGVGERARRKYYLNTRNRFWLLARNLPAHRLLAVSPWLILGECRALGRAVLSGEAWRFGLHVRAWIAALAYLPRAWRFRRTVAPKPVRETFWPLVRRRPLFCPAVVLPEKGWYAPVRHGGKWVRPIGSEATVKIPSGPLRLSLVNCYPEIGPVEVAIALGDAALGILRDPGEREAIYHTNGGTLTLRSASLFPPSATGHPMEIGAWLQISSNDNPLV